VCQIPAGRARSLLVWPDEILDEWTRSPLMRNFCKTAEPLARLRPQMKAHG